QRAPPTPRLPSGGRSCHAEKSAFSSPASPACGDKARRGAQCGWSHPADRVDNINAAVMDSKEKIRILSEEAKIGAHRKPMLFLHLSDCGGVFVELEQA
uniref:Uncharacterized protein n=1 Tax=Ovis aries TaxID=9940 RepID=A0AC11ENY0_SHEEP